MPLTLQQYASYLDTRTDLPWPAAQPVVKPRARPFLVRLDGVRCVLWNVYGTLLAVPGGELLFEHPQPFVMQVALDKAIREFKMWTSMSRKPGQPADYLLQIYQQVLREQGYAAPGERHPEVASDQLWAAILKKLLQKDYKFDVGFFGSLNEFAAKVAFFFHSSLQPVAAEEGAADALRHVARRGLSQGLLADGQCFTPVQLRRALAAQDKDLDPDAALTDGLTTLSCEVRARKPSDRVFRQAVAALSAKGIEAGEVLHVGSRIQQDLIPARRLGMRTALYAGDRDSLQATPEQLRDGPGRPDVLLTELTQIAEVVG
jgi:FMN phosphatase YigB (HAD superfamily)